MDWALCIRNRAVVSIFTIEPIAVNNWLLPLLPGIPAFPSETIYLRTRLVLLKWNRVGVGWTIKPVSLLLQLTEHNVPNFEMHQSVRELYIQNGNYCQLSFKAQFTSERTCLLKYGHLNRVKIKRKCISVQNVLLIKLNWGGLPLTANKYKNI